MANSILTSHYGGTSNAILVSHGWPDGSSANSVLASHDAAYPGGTDTTPTAFSFTDQPSVATSTEITSAPITITGINAAATVTITGGTYQINGTGSFVSTSGSVNNLDTIAVRHTSSASNSTDTDTVLTVGGVSDTFTSTTVAASGTTLTHGASFAITSASFGLTGNQFGTKVINGSTVNAPLFHWNGDGTTPTFDWVQGESMSIQNSGWRASTPNARLSRYLVGKRSDGDYPEWDLVRSVSWPVIAMPQEVYASFLWRLDSSWDDSTHESGVLDHQLKPCSMQWHGGAYMDPPYTFHGIDGIRSTGDMAQEANDANGVHDGTWRYSGLISGNPLGGLQGANPRAGWVRVEFVGRFASDGFLRLFETTSIASLGRREVVNDDGETRYSGGALPADGEAAFHFGGYVRDYDTGNNWIYHTDLFLDVGSSTRVVLGNANTLAACTMLEPQPYTAWGQAAITLTGNCGGLTAGSTGYLYALTGANTQLGSPLAVTIAG